MWSQARTAITMLAAMTVLTGLLYPLAITAVAQVVFPKQANGSLIEENGRLAGSALIGQPFDDPRYFWSRRSATAPFPYNAGASAGSNQGATNKALIDAVERRAGALRAADPGNTAQVPVDLATASSSGLDPHISPAAAAYQIARVARARGVSQDTVRRLVERYTDDRQLFGILGQPRVNVLLLNLALDKMPR